MDLEGGVIHNEGRLKGWALKSRLFMGTEMGTSVGSAILGPKKSRFQGPPLQAPREMDFPHPKSIRPAPYKQLQVHW
jgi:hypothetical protein